MTSTSGFRTLVATVAAGLLVIAPARAHILADNLNHADGWGFTEPISSDLWLSASFTTDSRPWSLTSVDLDIGVNIPYFTLQDVDVRLFTSVGSGLGQPGVPLALLDLGGGVVPHESRFLAGGLALAPSTTYWVVVSMHPGKHAEWVWTGDSLGDGPGFLPNWSMTFDSGANWNSAAGGPFLMRVNAEPPPWASLGQGLAKVAYYSALPLLDADGDLTAGSPGGLTLSGTKPNAPAFLFVSTSSTPTPFKGGTLQTVPIVVALSFQTGAGGGLSVPWSNWPAGLSGTTLYFQYAIQDVAAPKGVALSNAMQGAVP